MTIVRNVKMSVAAVLMFLVLVSGLSANPSFIASPQRQASAGLFWSDADFFINPSAYGAMEFEKFFGLVSFDTVNMAKLGFASQFDNLYLAFYFGGNGLNSPSYQYSQDSVSFFGAQRAMKTYIALPGFGNALVSPDNTAALLIGIADMGIRLAFRSTYLSRTLDEDFMAGANFYKSFKDEKGSLNPEIGFGMTKDLTERGIMPKVYLSMDFFRDYQRFEQYSSATAYQEIIGRSNNVTSIDLTVGMGGFSLKSNEELEDFDYGVDLWYFLTIPRFKNDYNYLDGTTVKVGEKFKGLYAPGDTLAETEFTELSFMSHTIIPYLYTTWKGERISLGAELGLAVGFSIEKGVNLALEAGKNAFVKDGADYKTTEISFSPTLDLGLMWEIVPEKFFLNAGGNIGFGSLNFSTTTSETFANGSKAANSDSEEVDNNFTSANTRLNIGCTFNITPNFTVQAICGVDAGNVINTFSTSRTNGLAAFSEILATIKF